ncbi:TIM barrel protein [Pseudarthrobacter sp. NKDBFgelt]|uniref:TIM barrel protein n=1 Tax=Pseudarthrobacter sp. NKDBFgelt TaxID=3384443 RepID=UPI0038D3B59C
MSGDLPYGDRFATFAAAGFTMVETWWPFPRPDPTITEVDKFLSLLRENNLSLMGLNIYEGNLAAGDRGIASRPEFAEALEGSLAVAARIGAETGCRNFNLLYGNRDPGTGREEQDGQARESFNVAVEVLAPCGGMVLLEPLSAAANPDYPLRTPQDALDLLESLGERTRAHTGLLLDAYHLASDALQSGKTDTADEGQTGVQVAEQYAGQAAHIQIADCPGRGIPGSGSLDLGRLLRTARDAGYSGEFGCELLCDASQTVGIRDVLAALLHLPPAP